MEKLVQINIVVAFSLLDLLVIDSELKDIFKVKIDSEGSIESTQTPNALFYIDNKNKVATLLTPNQLRVDNNSGDESTNLFETFWKVFNAIDKISNPQQVAFGFNFTYHNSLLGSAQSQKFIKSKFLKNSLFSTNIDSLIKGAGVRFFLKQKETQYDVRIDPVTPESDSYQIQVNANYNEKVPSKSKLKTNFDKDLRFVKELIKGIK